MSGKKSDISGFDATTEEGLKQLGFIAEILNQLVHGDEAWQRLEVFEFINRSLRDVPKTQREVNKTLLFKMARVIKSVEIGTTKDLFFRLDLNPKVDDNPAVKLAKLHNRSNAIKLLRKFKWKKEIKIIQRGGEKFESTGKGKVVYQKPSPLEERVQVLETFTKWLEEKLKLSNQEIERLSNENRTIAQYILSQHGITHEINHLIEIATKKH